MSAAGPTPTPPIDPEDLTAERVASEATFAAETSALREAIARLYDAEKLKTPEPKEYENAKKLAGLNDRVTRVLLARVRPFLDPEPGTTSVEEIEGIGPAYAEKLKVPGLSPSRPCSRPAPPPAGASVCTRRAASPRS